MQREPFGDGSDLTQIWKLSCVKTEPSIVAAVAAFFCHCERSAAILHCEPFVLISLPEVATLH